MLPQPDGHYVATGRLPGGVVLLWRVLGGARRRRRRPRGRPGLRTLGARYLGQGRAARTLRAVPTGRRALPQEGCA